MQSRVRRDSSHYFHGEVVSSVIQATFPAVDREIMFRGIPQYQSLLIGVVRICFQVRDYDSCPSIVCFMSPPLPLLTRPRDTLEARKNGRFLK